MNFIFNLASTDPAPEYCVLWIQWWPLCMTKAEWSGWVQAIGSIAALVAGVLIVRWQLRRQKNDVIEDEVRRLETLSSLSFSATVDLCFVRRSLLLGRFNADLVHGVLKRFAAIRSLPLFEVPDHLVAPQVAEANGTFEVFAAFVARSAEPLNGSTGHMTAFHREWVTEVDHVLSQTRAIELQAVKAIERRGSIVHRRTHKDAAGEVVHETPDTTREWSVLVRNR